MSASPPPPADEATPEELRKATLRLFGWLLVVVVIGPAVRALPLGQTTRTGILAWLLVGMALYWVYRGLGYRALLLIQLMLFSFAAALLTIKGLLVIAGSNEFDTVRETARALLIAGGACAGANFGIMLVASALRRPAPDPEP